MVLTARARHFSIKTSDRQKTFDFYIKHVGMKILRHEEFEESCSVGCNGTSNNGNNGKWSKTQIGFGSEDSNFVFEVIYLFNYNNIEIKHGNDYGGAYVKTDNGRLKNANDPFGYPIFFERTTLKLPTSYFHKIILYVKSLPKALEFWKNLLGMTIQSQNGDSAILNYGMNQTSIELVATNSEIQQESGSGRITFSIPENQLVPLQESVKQYDKNLIQNEITELKTPNKPTVRVVILTDPNGHEICFFGEEDFDRLAQFDPKAEDLFIEAVKKENYE
uniref:VOC domain-containing protein n=1 Tax=Panagrolaimus sp. ES5 TaxID=591445 RepID=A0AC34FFL4_9BILA